MAGKRVVREVSWVTEVSALGDLVEKRWQTFSAGIVGVGGRAVFQWREWRLVRR